MKKRTLLDTQFRSVVLYSIYLLDESATVERMEAGPAAPFLKNWRENRDKANFEKPRISGVASDLSEENVLRTVGKNGRAHIYSRGEKFEEELEGVLNYLYSHEDINISTRDDGEIELSVDSESIYLPIELLYDMFQTFGYFDDQDLLLYKG